MQLQRIGITPIKGLLHLERSAVELSINGPVGDRVFALADLAKGRVLRTVENPRLLTTSANWSSGAVSDGTFSGGTLSVKIAGATITADVAVAGNMIELDYWGRGARLEVVEGPWAAAYSDLLGQEVALTRSVGFGQVVYGASVTVVTTGQLRELSTKVGYTVDPRRFRSTFVLDSDCPDPASDWHGHEIQLGSARIRILGEINRCAVVDFDADTGLSGSRLLQTLASYRLREQLIEFGMYAEVTRPGLVSRGDSATILP